MNHNYADLNKFMDNKKNPLLCIKEKGVDVLRIFWVHDFMTHLILFDFCDEFQMH